MKAISELRSLYELELKPQLAGLEKQRKTIKLFWYLAAIIVILLFLFLKGINNNGVQITIAILGSISTLFLFGFGVVKYYSYRKVFKTEIVTKIVHLINPNYHYNADKHISAFDFKKSKLFKKEPNKIKGDDFISGTIEKTDFKFSELKAEYKTESTSNGKKQTNWHTIFSGIFFHADFNKHLKETTFVLPDTAEKLFGKLGQKFQKANSRGELVKLENPAFEKEFVVYGTSQQEARYILTPTMMEAMTELKQKYNRKMHFSFIGDRVYCAISFNKGLFEPRIKKSGVNFKDIEEMHLLFRLIETIIHEMNLNTRIWTKK